MLNVCTTAGRWDRDAAAASRADRGGYTYTLNRAPVDFAPNNDRREPQLAAMQITALQLVMCALFDAPESCSALLAPERTGIARLVHARIPLTVEVFEVTVLGRGDPPHGSHTYSFRGRSVARARTSRPE